MSWDPILDGDLAARARIVLADLVKGLAKEPAPSHELALFWTYANACLDDDPEIQAHAVAAMGRFASDVERGLPESLALHDGLTGVAWVAAHVADGVEPLLAAVDTALLEGLAQWTGDYDLISGLVGFAVYCLERGDTPAALAGLARIVELLEATAIRTGDGVTWFSARDERHPDGSYNCGVAHGVPGVIAVLGRIAMRDLPVAPRAAALRDGAVRWLLAQRLPDGSFPAMAGQGPARTGWCYGDPGVAVALWDAVPRDLIDWTTRDAVGIRDAGLCHGSAGLAHMANRMFQATRDDRYRTYARHWFAHTLALHRPGEGIGGFTMLRPDNSVVTASLVEGSIGVALALLAGLAPLEPLWDRLFLCDLEPDQG